MNKLMEIRKAHNMSRAALADATGIGIRILEAYEQGRRELSKASVETVQKISSVLGVSIEELTEIESHPIRITDIEESPFSEDESYPEYLVKFDDGTLYEGVTTEDGDGDDTHDCIAHLRIGDVYADMDAFRASIKY